jgi:hypothetical protein
MVHRWLRLNGRGGAAIILRPDDASVVGELKLAFGRTQKRGLE